MFDANEQRGGPDMSQRRLNPAPSPMDEGAPPQRQMPKKKDGADGEANLDSHEMMQLHGNLLSIHRRELDRQFDNRIEQAIDEDFFDNIQWFDEDAKELKDRGQMPLVYNVIANAVNWVTGTEKRSRTDYKILPRRKEDGKRAETKTALMKYLSDVNRSEFHKSRSFEDAVKVGIGWLEAGVEDSDTGDPVYDRYESWRNILWDSASTELDLTDARFISRSKWVDEDLLTAMFEKRATLINESIEDAGSYIGGLDTEGDEAMDSAEVAGEMAASRGEAFDGYTRPRVRVVEMWYRKPIRTHMMVGGVFAGDLYDFSDAHDQAIHQGQSYLVRKRAMRVHVAIFTSKGMLWQGESPYRHNRFPFTPIWANRRGRDGMPYGLIRGLRDIQMDVNKRASKALYILSSQRVIMDEGAVPDMDAFEEEVNRPDGVIIKKKGYELRIEAERDLAQAHMDLMTRSIMMIQQQSGVTDELMGHKTNATSGIAIQRRQDQGSTTTTNMFDKLRLAYQIHGEKRLSLIEQYYTKEKEFRITSLRGKPEYVTLNSGLPDDDITRTKADFIIGEADWHSSLRQSAVDALLETMKTLPPQIAMVMLDLVVENMDLPNRDEIVKRIRASTGLQDPDATEPTPEMVQAAQVKQAAEEMQTQMQQATLDKLRGEAIRANAQAKHAVAMVGKVLADTKAALMTAVDLGVDAQGKAIDAAIKTISAQMAAPIADQMLREAGFEGEPERQNREAFIANAAQEAGAQQQAMQEQQQQQAPQPASDFGNGAPGITQGQPMPPQGAPQGAGQPSPQPGA